MSTNLYYEPVAPVTAPTLPTAMKWALEKRYGGSFDEIMDIGDMSYIEGLRDAGCDGAEGLITAIGTHGSVRVWVAE